MRNLASPRELGLVGFIAVCFILFHFDFSGLRRPLGGAGVVQHDVVVQPANDSVTLAPVEATPKTQIVHHVPGWTIFERLYIINGTMLIVTDKPGDVPDRQLITSTGVQISHEEELVRARKPTDKQIRVVSVQEAEAMFAGRNATVISGTTFMVSDNHQFLTHYYHFVAELLFGLWRTYASLDPSITADGTTSLLSPARFAFVYVSTTKWRDYAHMNEWVIRAAFPSTGLEFAEDWIDRAGMSRPFVFERVVLGDRAAAIEGKQYQATQRTASEPFALKASPHWWAPVRANVAEFAGIFPRDDAAAYKKGVITYISRQGWGRRMLKAADHDVLVAELLKLKEKYGYEVNIVSMDKLSREEQMRLAARTTIMMGVHGNGLTALLWMKPTPRSTVMEFFFPEGFAFDYEWTTRALGMTHYGFWGNKHFTSPNTPPVNYPEGFQGNEIPIDGRLVAQLCHERLTLAEEADD
ncbi:hypothetical protein EXIGLDRAFT_753895 [Exidia glandulosa HHB12029]|uniref:Glycosyltransferase 61 catalytic domain-containing protein n=1 Tax=Exidia glandulosa HHB12029 TaxID=1314781 RepID=A0A165DEK9_EXIGL|nr:hypothetical protein EXIGLDRAFT_753895 [Exidia glandulosa HHB12029]